MIVSAHEMFLPLLSFKVPGQARPRGKLVFGRDFSGRRNARRSPRSKAYQHAVHLAAASALAASGREPIARGEPVGVRITVFVPRPGRAPPWKWAARRPDLDNYVTGILNGCACLWHDDAQVVFLEAEKKYAGPGEEPCTGVTIYVLARSTIRGARAVRAAAKGPADPSESVR